MSIIEIIWIILIILVFIGVFFALFLDKDALCMSILCFATVGAIIMIPISIIADTEDKAQNDSVTVCEEVVSESIEKEPAETVVDETEDTITEEDSETEERFVIVAIVCLFVIFVLEPIILMHKEYAEHGDNPDEEYGSYEGDRDCCYCNDSEDMCHWLVVELPEDKNFVLPLLYPDAMELLRTLIDSVEDFLDDKGITPEMLPNADRESNSDAALIYGTDYDDLANRFAVNLGISIDPNDYYNDPEKVAKKIANHLPKDILYAAYRRQQMLYRVDDVYSHADDLGIEISEEEAEQIAEKFIENYDCNVAENDLFRELIRDFNKNRKRN